MSDWGRIYRGLWRHPKRQSIDWAALGLWAHCVSRSKDEKTAGFVKDEWVADVPDLVEQLVRERMWVKVDGGFRFNDWENWNAGAEKPKTTAARLVQEIIPPEHPSLVRAQLVAKVSELLENDGLEVAIVSAALKRWLEKTDSPVAFLPHFCSDVVRASGGDLEPLLRRCWKSGNVAPLAAHGFVYQPIDPEPGMSVEDVRRANAANKRKWIEQIRKELS